MVKPNQKNKSKYEIVLRMVAGLICLLFLTQIVLQSLSSPFNFWGGYILFLPILPLGFFALFGRDLALWLAVSTPIFIYVLMGILNFLRPHADM